MKPHLAPLLRGFTLLSALVAAPLPAQAQAADTKWTAGDSGAWEAVTNWDNGLPTTTAPQRTPLFDGVYNDVEEGILTVSINANTTAHGLVLENGSVLKLQSGSPTGYTLNTGAAAYSIGRNSSNNYLEVDNIALLTTTSAYIGFQSTAGTATNGNTLSISGSAGSLKLTGAVGIVVGRSVNPATSRANNNHLIIKQGALAEARTVSIGGAGNGNGVTVSGANSRLVTTTTGGQIGIGNNTAGLSDSSNFLLVENGGSVTSGGGISLINGYLELNNGTVSVGATNLLIGTGGKLLGSGQIVGSIAESTSAAGKGTGAIAEVGNDGYGLLDVIGNWANEGITLKLEVGNLSLEEYDFLDITGNFTYGGKVIVDMTNASFGSGTELQLVGWDQGLGSEGNLDVQFINGSGYDYAIRANGFYVTTAIPEPASSLMIAIGGIGWLYYRRRL